MITQTLSPTDARLASDVEQAAWLMLDEGHCEMPSWIFVNERKAISDTRRQTRWNALHAEIEHAA